MEEMLYPPEPDPDAPPVAAAADSERPPWLATWTGRVCGALALLLGGWCALVAMAGLFVLPRAETGGTIVILLASSTALASFALWRGGGALVALPRRPEARAPGALVWVAVGAALGAAPGAWGTIVIAHSAYRDDDPVVSTVWNEAGLWLWSTVWPLALAGVAFVAWIWWRGALARDAAPVEAVAWRTGVRRGAAGLIGLGLVLSVLFAPPGLHRPGAEDDEFEEADSSEPAYSLGELIAVLQSEAEIPGRIYNWLWPKWGEWGDPGGAGVFLRVVTHGGAPYDAIELEWSTAGRAAIRVSDHGAQAGPAIPALAALLPTTDLQLRNAVLGTLGALGETARPAWPQLREAALWGPEAWPDAEGSYALVDALWRIDPAQAEVLCVESLTQRERAMCVTSYSSLRSAWRDPTHSHDHAPEFAAALTAIIEGPDGDAAAFAIDLCRECVDPCPAEFAALAAIPDDSPYRFDAIQGLDRSETLTNDQIAVVRRAAKAEDSDLRDLAREMLHRRGHVVGD